MGFHVARLQEEGSGRAGSGLSRGTARGGAAPPERRRPAPARSGVWRWIDHVSVWFAVAVLVLAFAVLAIPTLAGVRDVLSGTATGSGALLQLVNYVAAEVTIVLMAVLAAYAAAPHFVRLAPGAVRVLGTLSFAGMFFLILLVLQAQLYAAVPVLVYFLSIRRRLADELPVFAGGRLQPERKARPREDVIRRPPRSWDRPSGGAKPRAGAKAGGHAGGEARGTAGGKAGKTAGASARRGGSGGRPAKKSRHGGGGRSRTKGR